MHEKCTTVRGHCCHTGQLSSVPLTPSCHLLVEVAARHAAIGGACLPIEVLKHPHKLGIEPRRYNRTQLVLETQAPPRYVKATELLSILVTGHCPAPGFGLAEGRVLPI